MYPTMQNAKIDSFKIIGNTEKVLWFKGYFKESYLTQSNA